MKMNAKLIRVIYFQALWFLIIYLGRTNQGLLALGLALVSVIVDYMIFKYTKYTKDWLAFSIFVFLCGLVIDTVLLQLKLVSFTSYNGPLSPLFMWAMWIIFIPYYPIGFHKLSNKRNLSLLLAFIFAPISYYSGAKQGALEFTSIYNLFAVATLWTIYFPISIKFFTRIQK
jgi:hypothetical protein